MSEALKILNNIRTLRAQARECTLETLEEMLEKLEVVVNERREEESAAAAEVEERARKLQHYRELLVADGIDPNELLNALSAKIAVTLKQNAQLVRLNTATLTKTAKLKPGLARAVLQQSSKKQWKIRVNPWMIS
jgi:DNA-binding protein H-NS